MSDRPWIWLFALGCALCLGCGPKAAPPATDGQTGGGSGGVTDDGESETGVTECEPPLVACGTKCVDLGFDREHCGACDHACIVTGAAGECWDAECTPNRHCVLEEEPYETCTQVCQRDGTQCATPRLDHRKWGAGSYSLHYGAGSVHACLTGGGGSQSIEASCDDPIDWSVVGGFNDELPVAATCKCLQL